MPDRQRVVVTGAHGFLGRAVVARFVADGHECIAATRGAGVLPGAKMLHVPDYSELVALPGAVLIHLAETRSITATDGAGSAHLEASTNLVRVLLGMHWEHVIYLSSAAVYGDRAASAHLPEENPEPVSNYGRTKLACEAMVLAEGGTVLRSTNLIGPGMAADNVLADILGQLDRTGPLVLRSLAPVRDYLWIEDAAELVVRAAGRQKGGIFNAASGRVVSVAELAKLVLATARQSSRPVVETRPVSDNSMIKLDIASTTRAFGWVPQTTLEAAMQILIHNE